MSDRKETVNKVLNGRNVFRIIIGTMTTSIVMIAFHDDPYAPTQIVLDLALFSVLLLVSYVFASVIGEEIIKHQQTSLKRILEIVIEVSPVVLATVPPLLIFVLASFGIFSVKFGLLLSDMSLLSILFLMGLSAGITIGGIIRGLLDGALAAGIGWGLVILRSMVIRS